jgi:hypothetical protein
MATDGSAALAEQLRAGLGSKIHSALVGEITRQLRLLSGASRPGTDLPETTEHSGMLINQAETLPLFS